MTDAAADTRAALTLDLPSEAATAALADWFAARLRPGDTILLSGEIGAGKTFFCRRLIQSRLAAVGRQEDVPSPTFTIVQIYDLGDTELWHCDLYRLTSADETVELGLSEAFESAICLVEWPDRLGDLAPSHALSLSLSHGPNDDARLALLTATDDRWRTRLADLAKVRETAA